MFRFGARLLRTAVLLAAAGAALIGAAKAQEGCPGLVARRSLPIVPASLSEGDVGLTFVGHATFLIESPGGLKIVTDYNDYVRAPVLPDVITMNHAHSTHYSDRPEAGIRTTLRGWSPDGGPAPRHDLQLGDVRIRNVVTNIRQWGTDATIHEGNSIFVFEVADLCIAHLGHLHHTLTAEHLRQLGRIDVALVPVDGSYTLDLEGMMEVLRALNAKIMIPMHYFGSSTLERFLSRADGESWQVRRERSPYVTLSRAGLPGSPEILVLPGR